MILLVNFGVLCVIPFLVVEHLTEDSLRRRRDRQHAKQRRLVYVATQMEVILFHYYLLLATYY